MFDLGIARRNILDKVLKDKANNYIKMKNIEDDSIVRDHAKSLYANLANRIKINSDIKKKRMIK